MTRGAGGADTRPNALSSLQQALSIVAAFNLAVAQPLLDVLRRHAEFFVAHDATGPDILLLVVAVTLLAPLSLCAVAWLARRLHPSLGVALHALILGTLLAALALQLLARTPPLAEAPVGWLVALSFGVGGTLVMALHRLSAARTVVNLTLPLPLVVAGLFLLSSPVSRLVLPATVSLARPHAAVRPPVVMLVFDELPLVSLMNEDGLIDGTLFPNFARFARASTWFRNTTTVDITTTRAVPALLDGRYPRRGRLPVVQDHPHNLFTLLAPDWKITAFEPVTQLCPPRVCDERQAGDPRVAKWNTLAADTALVALHVILPADLRAPFPPIDETWGAFTVVGEPEGRGERPKRAWWTDRLGYFRRFVDSIVPTSKPALYFMHSALPHAPWRYLPSGQQYRPPLPDPARGERGWGDDAWLVRQAYQRHLLQVALVDRLLGEAIRAVRQAGLYDRALIVVASDHGISFRPSSARRATGGTLAEIAPVPLFVKRPFQSKGAVSDRPVQTIDVLPTIADVLQLQLLGGVDGTSAFDARASARRQRLLRGSGGVRRIPPVGPDKLAAARRKYQVFAMKDGALDLFRVGPGFTRNLIGRPVHSFELGPPTAAAVRLSNRDVYRDVDPNANLFPGLVRGRITRPIEGLVLVIALNGKIAGVTKTFRAGEDGASFYSLLSPHILRPGHNRIEVFVVDRKSRRLRPVSGEQVK